MNGTRFTPPFVMVTALAACLASRVSTSAQEAATDESPGRFFVIQEPIDSDVLARVKTATKQLIARSAARNERPILVFEFRPGKVAPGSSEFGSSYDLATYLSTELAGAKQSVAYVPEAMKGYAVLPILACDEIVMGRSAAVGPITVEGRSPDISHRDPLKFLARRKGRDADLFLGLLEPESDLRVVRTGDRQARHVLAENLAEFQKTNQVVENRSAWEGGRRGVLSAQAARDQGFTKLLAESRTEITNVYHISGRSVSEDPTLADLPKPLWIKLDGPLDTVKAAYIARKVSAARQDGINLLILQINSRGGIDTAAERVAQAIIDATELKSVAYVDDQALGVSALVALACDEILVRKGGKLGDVSLILSGNGGQTDRIPEPQIKILAERAEYLAKNNGHPVAVARAMVDPAAVVIRAKDAKTGAVMLLSREDVEADPKRYLDQSVLKDGGKVLSLNSGEVGAYGLAQVVDDEDAFKASFDLTGVKITVDQPTWVDGVVRTLNDPFVGSLLLFVGIFMLILEIKMPGVGLPAIVSGLSFLLFFWSRFLSGTADQLEILLFIVGVICLGLEFFVFPGFGVFGMSGVLLILLSIVMAFHTFAWPTQEYEYRLMAGTLTQLTAILVGVAGGAALIGKYLSSIPLFNRLILRPDGPAVDEFDPIEKPDPTSETTYSYLVGEQGRTTTVLRPSGKARFGEVLVDVSSDGYYIGTDCPVEVVEVHGAKILVKPIA